MSKTPKVDSLVKRHEKETDALKRRILDSKTIQHRAIRQVTELLEHHALTLSRDCGIHLRFDSNTAPWVYTFRGVALRRLAYAILRAIPATKKRRR